AVMLDLACFAVEEFRSPDDLAAERSADRLMPQAYTENGDFAGQALYQLHGNSRFTRSARARRNDDALGLAANDFVDGDFVVAMHFHVAAQLAKILREVIGERVVVVQ